MDRSVKTLWLRRFCQCDFDKHHVCHLLPVHRAVDQKVKVRTFKFTVMPRLPPRLRSKTWTLTKQNDTYGQCHTGVRWKVTTNFVLVILSECPQRLFGLLVTWSLSTKPSTYSAFRDTRESPLSPAETVNEILISLLARLSIGAICFVCILEHLTTFSSNGQSAKWSLRTATRHHVDHRSCQKWMHPRRVKTHSELCWCHRSNVKRAEVHWEFTFHQHFLCKKPTQFRTTWSTRGQVSKPSLPQVEVKFRRFRNRDCVNLWTVLVISTLSSKARPHIFSGEHS